MEYRVTAVQADESIVSLEITATDMASAEDHARAQGYSVLHVTTRPWQLSMQGRKKAFSTLLFSQELLALLKAGLSLIESLEGLKERDKKNNTDGIIPRILSSLSEGRSLSDTLKIYPQHFPALYIALIQSSEKTGDLKEALQRYIEYQEQIDRIRKKIISASLYPIMLASVGSLVVLFLILYVVPRFAKVYEGISGQLPFFSRLLMHVGTQISQHEWAILGASISIAFLILWIIGSRQLREIVSAKLRDIPIISERLRLYELARLYRTLGMLLKGGVPMLHAISMTLALMQLGTRDQLQRAGALIGEGQPISIAMERCLLTTPIAVRMLAVGERTGDMGLMMERIAQFHEEDMSRWLEHFGKLFEPILMLAIGLVVGSIVVLMYMPIFELATAIQ